MRNPNDMFDIKWYLERNPDVAQSGTNPLIHYAAYGWKEGRDPSAKFSVNHYLKTYSDVRKASLEPLGHYLHKGRREGRKPRPPSTGDQPKLRQSFERVGLFDPATYAEMHPDVKSAGTDPLTHFLQYGMWEGRRFTTTELLARALSRLALDIDDAALEIRDGLDPACAEAAIDQAARPLAQNGASVAIYCNSHGNFFMREIANLLFWQLTALGIRAYQRTEEASQEEAADIRVFVAPHEFFWLGKGNAWRPLAAAHSSVLFNVEQVQTQWFCRALPFLLEAPLVLDINFQSAVLLRRLGINAIHYMPPYLENSKYTVIQEDISHIELVRGYDFSRVKTKLGRIATLAERPIDILFVGTGCERRLKALQRLRNLTDKYRFLCCCTSQTFPLTATNYRTTSPDINCALAQRAKIVLNLHRDWIGYFEWSRMVMQGFWQSACVVSDPSLPHPLFVPGEHLLEENIRHLPEFLNWLLGTSDGRERMQATAQAGHERAISLPAKAAMLVPMLTALGNTIGAQAAE